MDTATIDTSRVKDDLTMDLDRAAKSIIEKSTAKASAIAAIPIPLLDMAGVAYVQMSMVEKLAENYNVTTEDNSNLVVSSIVTGMVSKLCSELVGSIMSYTNMEKLLSEALIKASIAGFMTTITGEIFQNHFKSGQSIEDVNIETYISYIKTQFASDRVNINNISNSLIDKALNEFGLEA